MIRRGLQIGFNSRMRFRQAWLLGKRAVVAWSDDRAPSMGAALAFYTLFSIAPLLLIVVSIAGLVFGEEAARGEIFGQLAGLMGEEGARTLQALLQNVGKPAQGIVATVVGAATMLIGAMTVFVELQSALDRIWRAPAARAASGIFKLLRTRLLSFGIILGLGFLLMVSLVLSAALAALGKWWAPWFGTWAVLAEGLNVLLGLALVTLGFALIYKVVPRVRVEWRDVWIGAAVTSLLFAVGKFAIGFYLGRATFASGFGAAASLVVVLVWMYYSAQIFLMGAEFTWVYAHAYGSLSERAPSAGRVSTRASAEAAVRSARQADADAALAATRAAIAGELDAAGKRRPPGAAPP